MAGLGGLPYYIQDVGALQQQQAQRQQMEFARQEQEQRMFQFQQSQEAARRQQRVREAYGQSLPQLAPPPVQQAQVPPPQTPMPGQPSQPMVQPGQVPPVPQGAAPQGQPAQAPLPPYRALPTSPVPQGAPGAGAAVPPPPTAQAAPQGAAMSPIAQADQGAPFSLGKIVEMGQKQGLSGTDLADYVDLFQPMMTAQQKAVAENVKTQIELKKLDATIQYHQSMAQNQLLSIQERQKHDAALEKVAMQRANTAAARVAGRGAGGGEAIGGATPLEVEPGGELPPAKGGGGLTGPAVDGLAKRVIGGDEKAMVGLGRKERIAVQNRVAQVQSATGGASTDITTAGIERAAARRGAIVNAQQAAKVDAASNALTSKGGIGDQYQKAMDDLNRIGIPFANEAQMAILRAKYDPRVSAFDTAQNGVVSEVAQILGRGSITVHSMQEAKRVVDGWKTSEQAKSGLAQLKAEAATTIKASREEVKAAARGGEEASKGPKVGTVESGYRFKGGDPSKQSSWEKVQ